MKLRQLYVDKNITEIHSAIPLLRNGDSEENNISQSSQWVELNAPRDKI